MISREINFLYRAEEKSVFNSHRTKIAENLKLKEVVTNIPSAVEEGVVTDIAKNLIRLSKELKIPLPSIGIIVPTDKHFAIKSQNGKKRYALANSSISEENPEGIIKFSPLYLDHLISFRMGFDEEKPSPIEWLVSHEAFHLWQHRNNPEAIVQDCMQYENGAEAWETTLSEIHANEFAKRWLERFYRK